MESMGELTLGRILSESFANVASFHSITRLVSINHSIIYAVNLDAKNVVKQQSLKEQQGKR
jgi:hypothetical protein